MTEGHLVDGNLGDTLDGLERDEKRVLIHDGKILAQHWQTAKLVTLL